MKGQPTPDARCRVMNLIEALIEDLERSRSWWRRERWGLRAEGWDDNTTARALEFLTRLKRELEIGQISDDMEWAAHHLVRALDLDGITDGRRVDSFAELQMELARLAGKERATLSN